MCQFTRLKKRHNKIHHEPGFRRSRMISIITLCCSLCHTRSTIFEHDDGDNNSISFHSDGGAAALQLHIPRTEQTMTSCGKYSSASDVFSIRETCNWIPAECGCRACQASSWRGRGGGFDPNSCTGQQHMLRIVAYSSSVRMACHSPNNLYVCDQT